jgi:hypothetical protein
MTTKNLKLAGSRMFPAMVIIFVTATFFFSCKKSTHEVVPVKNDMVEAARVLDSKVISGNITTQSNEEEIALNYNSGDQLILIEKIKGMGFVNISSIKSAEIITSKYGIILKDAGSNSIFLLANNDPESIKMFERIKPFFSNNTQSATVFGVTVVNAEKA